MPSQHLEVWRRAGRTAKIPGSDETPLPTHQISFTLKYTYDMIRSKQTNLDKTPTTRSHPNPFLLPQFNGLLNNFILLNDLVYQTYLEKLGLSPSAGEQSVSEMLRVGDTVCKEGAK